MTQLIGTAWQLTSALSADVMIMGVLIVIALSMRDFHEPWRVSEVRYSVLRERYYFALAVNAVLACAIYAVLVYLFREGIFYILRRTMLFGDLQSSFEATLATSPEGKSNAFVLARLAVMPLIIAVSAIGALFVLVLLPRVWPFSSLADAVRRGVQALARYPHSAETLTAVIGRSRFTPTDDAQSTVTEELRGYGVSRRLLGQSLAGDSKVISPIAAQTLVEIGALHLAVLGLQDDRRFRRFFLARRDFVDQVEAWYSRLMRRAARAILAAEDVAHLALTDLTWDISEFVAEEADALRMRYHRMLADAALSILPTPIARQELLSRLGYDIALPQVLPLAPLVFVFALDLLIGLAPIAIVRIISVPAEATLATHYTAVFAFVQAFALAAALFWAVWPKAVFSSARPSLVRLPWRSYIVFGGISYAISTLVMYGSCKLLPLPAALVAARAPLLVCAIYATIFLVITCGVSVLLDRRLRDLSLDFRQHRVRDGVTLAFVLAVTFTGFLLIYIGLEVWYDIPSDAWWPISSLALFVAFYTLLGFAIGYFLPSAAEAHLEAKQIILESAERGGKLVDIFAGRYNDPLITS